AYAAGGGARVLDGDFNPEQVPRELRLLGHFQVDLGGGCARTGSAGAAGTTGAALTAGSTLAAGAAGASSTTGTAGTTRTAGVGLGGEQVGPPRGIKRDIAVGGCPEVGEEVVVGVQRVAGVGPHHKAGDIRAAVVFPQRQVLVGEREV